MQRTTAREHHTPMIQNPTKLTAKREAFCHEMLKDNHQTNAALRAGYSITSASTEGSRLMQMPMIQERIAQLRAELAARTAVHPEKIVRELATIAFADVGDVLRLAHDGESLVFDFENMPPEFTRTISSIKVDTYMHGRGDRGREVRSVDVKMIDKRGALVDLAKIFGMMREQVDHNITARHDDEGLDNVDDATLAEFIRRKAGVVVREQPVVTTGEIVASVNIVGEGGSNDSGTDGQQERDANQATTGAQHVSEGAKASEGVGESEATPPTPSSQSDRR